MEWKKKGLIIAKKLPRRQIKDSWHSDAATQSYISALNLFLNLWKILLEEFIIGNVAGYRHKL